MAISKTPEIGPDAWADRSKPKVWEKNAQDIDNSQDGYHKARDIGVARINYSRLNLVAELSKNDSVDYYKFNAISRGNLRITIRDSSSSENPDGPLELDVNKYLKAAGIEVEEETDSELTDAEKKKSEFEEILENLKVKNVRMQLITVKSGREIVVADSAGEEDSKEFDAFESLSMGEYRVRNPEMYYIKVSRNDEKQLSEAHQYAIQVQIGENHKHDYMTVEKKVDETAEYAGKKGSYLSSKAQLALDNAMQVSSSSLLSAQSAANMVSDGYLNLNTILNPSKINLFG